MSMKDKTSKKSPTVPTRGKRKPSDKEQYERFRQAARELGTDESEEAFERAFRKILRPTHPGRA
jgi:hypothetical protein